MWAKAILVAILAASLSLTMLKQASEMPTDTVLLISAENPGRNGTVFNLFLDRADYAAQICCDHSLTNSPIATDEVGLWFTIDRSDPLIKGSHRAELRFASNKFDSAVGFDTRVFVPENWEYDSFPVLAMQWHSARDRYILEGGRLPPLEISIEGNEWIVRSSSDPNFRSASSLNSILNQIELARAPIIRGNIANWTVDVVWTWRNDGRLRVSLNDNILVDYTGPTAHRDWVGPYFKFGIYSPKWKDYSLSGPSRHSLAFLSVTLRKGIF